MARVDEPSLWRICLEGRVEGNWTEWFDRMTTRHEKGADGSWRTLIEGWLCDQAALRGLITRMWDLNLRMLSLTRLDIRAKGEKA